MSINKIGGAFSAIKNAHAKIANNAGYSIRKINCKIGDKKVELVQNYTGKVYAESGELFTGTVTISDRSLIGEIVRTYCKGVKKGQYDTFSKTSEKFSETEKAYITEIFDANNEKIGTFKEYKIMPEEIGGETATVRKCRYISEKTGIVHSLIKLFEDGKEKVYAALRDTKDGYKQQGIEVKTPIYGWGKITMLELTSKDKNFTYYLQPRSKGFFNKYPRLDKVEAKSDHIAILEKIGDGKERFLINTPSIEGNKIRTGYRRGEDVLLFETGELDIKITAYKGDDKQFETSLFKIPLRKAKKVCKNQKIEGRKDLIQKMYEAWQNSFPDINSTVGESVKTSSVEDYEKFVQNYEWPLRQLGPMTNFFEQDNLSEENISFIAKILEKC